MKVRDIVAGALFGIGLLIVVGSVGAVDNNIIGFGRCVWQSLIGVALVGTSAWIERKEI